MPDPITVFWRSIRLGRGWLLMMLLSWLIACAPEPHSSSETVAEEGILSHLSLSERLVRLEDREAILRLQRAYGFYLSKGDWQAVADLFANEAVLDNDRVGHVEGREAILAALRAQPHIGGGFVDGVIDERFQLQPVLHVDADGLIAQARWREWIMRGTMGDSAQWGDAINRVRYTKSAGVWQIAALSWHERFVVDYDGGWARNRSIHSGAQASPVWPERMDLEYGYSPDQIAVVQSLAVESAQSIDEQRIAYLEDVDAIEDLLSAFGYYLDNGDWTLAASLFSEQGTAERGQRGVYVGRDRIAQMFALDGPEGLDAGQLNNHLQVQAVIHIAPDRSTAWSRSRVIMQTGQFGGSGYWGDAVVENTYHIEQGRWRIARHRFYPTFISDYDKGFVAGAVALEGISETLPPDHPPSVNYGALPEVFTPPWHYAHPVSGVAFEGPAPAVTEVIWPGQAIADNTSPLHARLTRLEDIRSVTNLQRSYGFIVDKALWQETSQLFSADGTMEIGGRGVFNGPDRIHHYYTFLGAAGPQYGRLINHIQLQPLVSISDAGDEAFLHAHFLAQGGDLPSKEAPPEEERGVQVISYLGTGWYSNRYVKEHGIWKIGTLHGLFRMYTFEDKGWARFALPSTRPETKMPPDSPPTLVYDLYPTTWFPREHFAHPVTGAVAQPSS